MKIFNLALRFVLELCALAAVSYAGYHAVEGEAARFALCIAAPILFAVLWGLFAAHKAKFPPPGVWKAVVGFLLLEGGALSLVLAGQGFWAGVFAVGPRHAADGRTRKVRAGRPAEQGCKAGKVA